MAAASPKVVRLVRCPKCRLLLPELAHVPVYRCGGCKTVLLAKNRISHDDAQITPLSQQQPAPSSHLPLHASQNHPNQQDIVTSLSSEDSFNTDDASSTDTTLPSQLSDSHHSPQSQSQSQSQSQAAAAAAATANLHLDTQLDCDTNTIASDIQTSSLDMPVVPPPTQSSSNTEITAADEQPNAYSDEEPHNKTDHVKSSTGGDTTSPAASLFPPKHQLQQSQTSEYNRFPLVRSTDADAVIPTSELSGRLDYFPKSATIRSSRAYDASISSYDGDGDGDGLDDIDPLQSMKYPNQAANDFLPVERLPRHNNNFLVNSIRSRNSSELSSKNPYATNYHSRGPKEPGQHFTDGASFRKGKTLVTYDNYLSEAPFYQNATLAGYESASTSSQLHHELPRNSTEQERMKLLRMVNELHNALNKTCNLNANSTRRPSLEASWKENQFPRYYDSEATSEEIIHSRNLGRTRQRSACVHQSRFSRRPFSGDALNSGLEGDPSCLYCHPQDWQRSVQLRPSMSRGHYMNHYHPPGYNCYSSCPASHQRNMESDFLARKSSDQRYSDHELRKRLREKRYSIKRHVRSTAGGAPFVTCYSCLNLLQLPADFLLFKRTRRVHQLKCGACLKVLEFSLNGGTQIVPYEPALVVPPPSEVDGYSYAVAGVKASSRPEPVSFSENYGLCSTDMDTSENVIKNSVEIYACTMSSEMEKQQRRTRRATSPLHRLMGYSSASEVIKGS